MPEIILRHKGAELSRTAVGDREITIGRVESNDLVLPNAKVSRHHARIVPHPGGAVIEDCGSRTGCFFDGARVSDHPLGDGDEIWIEDYCLEFRADRPARDGSPAGSRGAPIRFEEGRGNSDPDWGLLRTAFGDPRAGVEGEKRLQALFDIGELVDEAQDFGVVLAQIMDQAIAVMGAERGFLMLTPSDGGELETHVARDLHGDITGVDREKISHSLLGRVMASRKPVLVHDAQLDAWDSASVVENSIHSAVCAPLLTRDTLAGVLYVDDRRRRHAFTRLDLAFFAMFARQAKVAIDGSRAYWDIQRRLAEKERLASLGAMVAAVAHEIKNPLNFVLNFAELSTGVGEAMAEEIDALAGRIPADAAASLRELAADAAGNAAKIRAHAQRIDGIIDTMRRHATHDPASQSVDVNPLLVEHATRAHQAFRAEDAKSAVALETSCDEAAGAVLGAREKLGQVVANLVKNACQAAAAQREGAPLVRVSSRGLSDRVELRVSDNGAGIPEAIRGRVFEPFFTTRPAGEGVGLGLSICYDVVVLRHRGELRIETEEGRGTELVVTLLRSPIGNSR